jgi:hypothetical protein
MSDLSALTDDDLRQRMDRVLVKLQEVVKEMTPLLQPLAPYFKEAGHLREESEIILMEMRKRGIDSSYQPPQVEDSSSG